MDEINMDVDDGVSEASSIASDRLGDDIDNSLTEEQHLCRVVDDAEELALQEQVLQDQIDEEQRLCRAVDAALIQNVRNISHDLSVALRDLSG
jgi:branched-subunit amino acid aminotransferase/4-amino-4-deoxychorismate lyase